MWGTWAGAASLGLGVRLSPQWRIVARLGAGQAWASREQVKIQDLRVGGSLGVARNTRVGPIAVDLGVGGGTLKVYVALGFR
jgi:outer membrane translocation and assembly module TamA